MLLPRPPLKSEEASFFIIPLDLHVLGTPPAFVLSQDQTLPNNVVIFYNPTRINGLQSCYFRIFNSINKYTIFFLLCQQLLFFYCNYEMKEIS